MYARIYAHFFSFRLRLHSVERDSPEGRDNNISTLNFAYFDWGSGTQWQATILKKKLVYRWWIDDEQV